VRDRLDRGPRRDMKVGAGPPPRNGFVSFSPVIPIGGWETMGPADPEGVVSAAL